MIDVIITGALISFAAAAHRALRRQPALPATSLQEWDWLKVDNAANTAARLIDQIEEEWIVGVGRGLVVSHLTD